MATIIDFDRERKKRAIKEFLDSRIKAIKAIEELAKNAKENAERKKEEEV